MKSIIICWNFKDYCFESFPRHVSTDDLRGLKILFFAYENEETTLSIDYESIANNFCWRKYFKFPKPLDKYEEYAENMDYNVNKFMFFKRLGYYICHEKEHQFDFSIIVPNFIERSSQSIKIEFFTTYNDFGKKCLSFKIGDIKNLYGVNQQSLGCFFTKEKSIKLLGINSYGKRFCNPCFDDYEESGLLFIATNNSSASFTRHIEKAIDDLAANYSYPITKQAIKEKKELCEKDGYNIKQFLFVWLLSMEICTLDPNDLDFDFKIEIPNLKEDSIGIVEFFHTYNVWGDKSIAYKIKEGNK